MPKTCPLPQRCHKSTKPMIMAVIVPSSPHPHPHLQVLIISPLITITTIIIITIIITTIFITPIIT